jgi:hypothetical protein
MTDTVFATLVDQHQPRSPSIRQEFDDAAIHRSIHHTVLGLIACLPKHDKLHLEFIVGYFTN